MYQSNNIIPNNGQVMYQNHPHPQNGDRFLAPFLVGGIAGTALGYGIGVNHNYGGGGSGYGAPIYYVPGPYIPPYNYSQNFYY